MKSKRVQQDINNFWIGQAPETVSVTHSRWIGTRPSFCGAESMGVCFSFPPVPIAPSCSKISEESAVESAVFPGSAAGMIMSTFPTVRRRVIVSTFPSCQRPTPSRRNTPDIISGTWGHRSVLACRKRPGQRQRGPRGTTWPDAYARA